MCKGRHERVLRVEGRLRDELRSQKEIIRITRELSDWKKRYKHERIEKTLRPKKGGGMEEARVSLITRS
jgi:hypothetical protein